MSSQHSDDYFFYVGGMIFLFAHEKRDHIEILNHKFDSHFAWKIVRKIALKIPQQFSHASIIINPSHCTYAARSQDEAAERRALKFNTLSGIELRSTGTSVKSSSSDGTYTILRQNF